MRKTDKEIQDEEKKYITLWDQNKGMPVFLFAEKYNIPEKLAMKTFHMWNSERNEYVDFYYLCSGLACMEKAIQESSFVDLNEQIELLKLSRKLHKKFLKLKTQFDELRERKADQERDIVIGESNQWRYDERYGDQG